MPPRRSARDRSRRPPIPVRVPRAARRSRAPRRRRRGGRTRPTGPGEPRSPRGPSSRARVPTPRSAPPGPLRRARRSCDRGRQEQRSRCERHGRGPPRPRLDRPRRTGRPRSPFPRRPGAVRMRAAVRVSGPSMPICRSDPPRSAPPSPARSQGDRAPKRVPAVDARPNRTRPIARGAAATVPPSARGSARTRARRPRRRSPQRTARRRPRVVCGAPARRAPARPRPTRADHRASRR